VAEEAPRAEAEAEEVVERTRVAIKVNPKTDLRADPVAKKVAKKAKTTARRTTRVRSLRWLLETPSAKRLTKMTNLLKAVTTKILRVVMKGAIWLTIAK
jgi:hypothetical protein